MSAAGPSGSQSTTGRIVEAQCFFLAAVTDEPGMLSGGFQLSMVSSITVRADKIDCTLESNSHALLKG